MAVMLGQSVFPETAPYLPAGAPQGQPCSYFACETWIAPDPNNPNASPSGELVFSDAKYFNARLDLSTMTLGATSTDELAFFLILTSPNTSATVAINRVT